MGDKTSIEWCRGEDGSEGATWNPIRARNLETGGVGHFCTHASDGCRFCYAERLQSRFRNPVRYAAQDRDKVEIFLDEEALTQPLRWRKPRRIFVCSMTDLFGEFVSDEWIDRIYAVMALSTQHTFQVLTKRAARMRHYLSYITNRDDLIAKAAVWIGVWDNADAIHNQVMHAVRNPLPNVWLGVSAERQQEADERIPDLLATPAAVRFVSLEPLLGPIDLTCVASPYSSEGEDWRVNALRSSDIHYHRCINAFDGEFCEFWYGGDGPLMSPLDWVIVGGESGKGARPMHPDWARSIRDQCAAAGVPYFMKQMGGHPDKRAALESLPEDLRIRETPKERP